ncbi:hypothetical protein KQY30_35200 [Streptomyces sp. GMY02]|nr:hypothetical protein [Streptomyces sp. GMY02]QXE38691.1 hypothetical protein KQY30_35200 [Streptomyces sp. GMY02]
MQYGGNRRDVPDSPGHTDQRKRDEERPRTRLLELSVPMSEHPYLQR